MAFFRDNQSVVISDLGGNIKMIKWQTGANSGDDFHIDEEPKQVYDGKNSQYVLQKTRNTYLLDQIK